jgi:hypothetical protein
MTTYYKLGMQMSGQPVIQLVFQFRTSDRHTYYTGKQNFFFHFLLTLWVILIVLTLLTLNMTTKLPYHPLMFRKG